MRFARAQRADKRELVVEVGLDQLDPVDDSREVRVALRAAVRDAEDLVIVREQQFGEERAVLPADPGDERTPLGHAAMIEP